MAVDALGRELSVGDYVFFYSNIYRVTGLDEYYDDPKWAYIYIKKLDVRKSTRPVKKYSREMCLIPGQDISAWALRTGIILGK